ncbi:amyloid protein-binding protein 2 [Elysia marginata]|uniref:Amyloid protein-binding protein 2 n=1 Tax=Elysia marginata TaxID=1093978 RepID=A0AAV4EYU1_9GAST|nr:amyloid protein-binding protein 2 [Elysia marginata]
MATSIRRNTFVLKDPTVLGPRIGPSTGKNKQNVMRLKVNKIALVQELRVEHVTGFLVQSGVITDKDIKKIDGGHTPQDKARILVDLLPTKSKDTEWYKHFREALQNPEASPDTKRRYKLLVDFLDNTVIHRPTSQAGRFRDSLPPGKVLRGLEPLPGVNEKETSDFKHYQRLPDIGYSQEESSIKLTRRGSENTPGMDMEDGFSILSLDSNRNMTLVKGFFQQWLPTPDNFRSLIDIDPEHQQRLKSSSNPADHQMLAKEEMSLKNLRKLEIIATLAIRKQLPSGFELCMCDAVQDILNQQELHHLYLKHLMILQAADLNLVKDICMSYETVLQMLDSSSMTEIVTQVIQTGLKLASFLMTINHLDSADSVLTNTLNFLGRDANLDAWLPRYQAYVKLMHCRNLACQPDKAQLAYFDAAQMQFQEVDTEDPAAVVRTLCVAVNAYCAQWMVRKTEALAVFLVQYARSKFGERHPLYIEALIHFCHFNNEFKQDSVGLEVAKELLYAAKQTYGCESIQVASAHRALSKALMCTHKMETDDYYTHAMDAVRIARAVLGQHAPRLHVYLHTLASALQWKALHCPKEVHDSTLRWAEAEAKQALSLVSATFGEISLKSAHMLLLLGQIYSKMNRLDAAERHMIQAVDYLKLCQPPSSHYLLLGMANLATFYKIILKPELAVPRYQYVVDHAEPTGWYLKWIHMCYETLASLLTATGQTRQADQVQVQLSHWLKAHPHNAKGPKPVDLATLRLAEPPTSFVQFVDVADLWGAAVRKVRGLPQEGGTMALGEQDEVAEEGGEQTQNVLVVQRDDCSNVDSAIVGSDQTNSKDSSN